MGDLISPLRYRLLCVLYSASVSSFLYICFIIFNTLIFIECQLSTSPPTYISDTCYMHRILCSNNTQFQTTSTNSLAVELFVMARSILNTRQFCGRLAISIMEHSTLCLLTTFNDSEAYTCGYPLFRTECIWPLYGYTTTKISSYSR